VIQLDGHPESAHETIIEQAALEQNVFQLRLTPTVERSLEVWYIMFSECWTIWKISIVVDTSSAEENN
jgi:hypothetical protein